MGGFLIHLGLCGKTLSHSSFPICSYRRAGVFIKVFGKPSGLKTQKQLLSSNFPDKMATEPTSGDLIISGASG